MDEVPKKKKTPRKKPAEVKPKYILHALLRAQRDVPRVEANARTGEYSYVTAERMMEACREVLHKHNLCTRRIAVAVMERKSGALVTSTFELALVGTAGIPVDRDTYEYESLALERYGLPLDKSISAQCTIMWSMFLRDLLLVPRFDPSEQIREDVAYVTAGEEFAKDIEFNTERPVGGQANATKGNS